MSEENRVTYFFLFHSIHDVLRAEKDLKGRGVAFELVPVPRVLSSDCGVCIASESLSDDFIPLLFSINVDRCFSFNGKEYARIDTDGLKSWCDDKSKE